MIELVHGWSYDDGDDFYFPVTNKRTPKYKRVLAPRELYDRYAAAKAEYEAACDALQKALRKP